MTAIRCAKKIGVTKWEFINIATQNGIPFIKSSKGNLYNMGALDAIAKRNAEAENDSLRMMETLKKYRPGNPEDRIRIPVNPFPRRVPEKQPR